MIVFLDKRRKRAIKPDRGAKVPRVKRAAEAAPLLAWSTVLRGGLTRLVDRESCLDRLRR
jgi:hypothetical protein